MKNPTNKLQDIFRKVLQCNTFRSGRLLLSGIAIILISVTTVFAQDVTIGSGTTVTNPSGTTLNINGNLTINSGGTLANAGTIIITGNWTNNGTYSGAGAVQFTGALSSTISGSSASLINTMTINKGSSTATILDVNGTGAVSCSTVTFSNGLLKINAGGSFSKVNGNITAVASTSGIHVSGGTFSAVNSVQSMAGSFTVSSGSATVGTSSGNSLQATSTSTVAVSGGTLNIASRLEMSGGSLNISGGVITLNTVANTTASTGSLNMTATANLNMTNGTVIFQFPNSTGFQDVNILAGGGTKTITGGTLQFGNASTAAASIFKISSPIPVNNITINSTNNPQLTLVAALTINGTLTMNGGNVNPAGLALLENNTAPTAIVRTSGFVNGQLKWQLPASVIAPGAYLFPVGKNSTYLPYTLTNPSGNSPLISVEAFDIGSGGSADLTTVFGISNTEYWLASFTGTYTGGSVTLTRPAPVTPNDQIARHATLQAGPYSSIGGSPSGNSISGGNTLGTLGYFVMAQGCTAATFSACPSNTTASTALNLCTATVSYTATVTGAPTPTVSYTFSGATTGSGSGTGSGSVFNKGNTNVIITATNACGSATCTLTVTVNDNQAPNAICQNITVNLDATGNASITPSQVNNGSTDNCGVVNLVSVTPNTFNCSNIGLAASATDLIFSEYVEGSGNNKYVEIFNGTSGAINLGDYRLRLYANGSSSTTNDVLLSGTLNAGQTIVYRNTSAVIYGGAAIVNAAVNFNGNDALALFKISTASNVDIFGRIGNDPIGSWTLGGNTTVDKTLRRKPTVVSGVTVNPTGTGPGAFLTLATEWDQFNIDDVTGLGAHTFTPPPAPTPVTLTINDGNGNTSTCVANVTVQDVTPPTAICQNISVNLSGTGTVSVNASQVNNGSSDACGVATMTLAPNSFTCANVGPNPVTLTVTDVHGLSSTCTATVTVVDNTPPVASCQNITINLSAAGTASITASQINNGSSDNCAIASMTVNPNTFNCSNVTAGGGSSSAWINEFHYDNSSTDAGEFIEIAGTAGLNLTGWSVVLYNGANGLSYTTTPLSGSIVNQINGFGFAVVNYPVDGIQNGAPDGIALVNNLGNVIQFLSYEGSFTALNGPANGQTSVNIPVSEAGGTAPGSSLQLTGTGNNYASFTWAPEALATSNAVNNGQTFVAPIGNTVTLTVTDVNGLSSTCTAIVSVLDVTPPVATCQNITVPLNANGTVTVTASQVNNGSSDACGIASMALSQTSFTCANVGPNPVTLTVTDANGLTATCSATITITDVTPPVANCQNLTIALDGTGNASITASQINNGSSDACGLNPNMTVTPNTFNCSDIVGDPMNDLIISEYIEGNVLSNKYIELYNGTAAPINLGNYRLRLYANGSTATTNDVLLAGTLGVGQTIVYQNSAATFYTGPAINNAAVNFNGDDAVVLFKVSTGIPVDIFGRIGEDPGAAWTSGAITTVDVALRRKPSVIQGVTVNPASGFPTLSTEWDQFAPGDVSGLGAHVLNGGNLVTLTVTDVNGNSSTCTAYVTVQDVTAPTVNCPVVGNTNRNTDPGACTYTGVGTEFDATASDNCSFTLTYQLLGATIGTGTSLAGIVFNKGITLVKWTASDGVNAPVLCSFTVTVIDNQQPLITCPVAINANRNTNPGLCTYTVVGTEFNATSTDNCAVTSLTYALSGVTSGTGTSLAGVVFSKGVTTVTWTTSDGVNAAVTCSFTVTVIDNEQPVITCPVTGNTNRNTNAGQCTYAVSGTEFNATSTDNCIVTSMSYTLSGATSGTGTSLTGVLINKGITSITWTASDGVNTAVTCSFTVTVIDNQQPVITCPVTGNTNRNTNSGLCTYTVSGTEFNATSTDNCIVTSMSYTLSGATSGTGTSLTGVVINKGITSITWTASDGVNTAVTCSFTVTVIDNQQPLITCPVAINANRNTNPGLCTYTVVGTEFNATSTDNCAVTSMTYTLGGVTSGSGTSLTGVVFNKGVTSITWTASDGINPAVTCSFTVTVVDAEFPVFTLACPASFAACNAPGISWTPPIASDNCSVVLTSNMSPGDIFPPGTTTVTYSAQDPAGNITTCSFDVTVKQVSQNPVSASALPAVICSGGQITLSVNGGFLGTGANWKWYSGSCGGTLVGIGASIQLNPLANTTYFVRAEGDCNTTNCASVSVTVQTTSTDPTSATSNAPVNGICIGGSVILTVSGGSLGTGAVWKWYEDGCGNGLSIGTGSSITITPSFEGLHSYYVRAEGPCNTTNCAAVSVLVGTYSVEAASITSSNPGNSICTGNNITLTLDGGFLGTVAQWKWYSGSCGGTLVATGGTSITVNPAATTTYYVRAEGSCNTTSCVSITVFVSSSAPSQHANIIQSPQSICSGNQGTFTCQTVSNATFYSWSAPNGTTFNGNNPSPYVTTVPTVNVTFGVLPNGVNGYDICVFAGNGCGTSATKCKHVNGRTITPQIITGNASSCPNTSSLYSCTSSPGADTYLWTITGNATFTNGNDSIVTTGTSTTVNFGPGWTSGILSVFAQMSCGYQSPAKTITIISTPVVPGVMSGPALVCPNTTYGFSIAAVSGAVSYNWSTNVPSAIVSPAGTSCSITFPSVIPAGSTVSVTATGSCGTSAPRVKNIATGMANTPGTISGPAMGQCGQTGVGYSILPVAGATSYLWTATNGANISGLNNITSVSVNFPAVFTTSNVSVQAINSCGNSAPQTKLVTGAPGSPGAITGSGAVCLNSVETYSVIGSTGATQYLWTSPAGSQILTGQNSASIEVLYFANTGGNISVTASNACGSSAASNLAVSVVCRLAQISQGSLIDATLYPNPTFGTTTLKFETVTAGDYKVSVVDMTGQVMQTKNVTAVEGVNLHELDLSTYAKGLYMVRLEREGEAMQMLRVTVE